MRLLFIRHGDPNYEYDGLTEKGKREAEALAKHIKEFGIDEAYVSPLGRAKETADYALKALGMEATTFEWLKEFPALFDPNEADEETRKAFPNEIHFNEEKGRFDKRIVWDIMPSYYMNHPELFDAKGWRGAALVKASNAVEVYDDIIENFDKFLAGYGYERNGGVYKVTESNDKTIAIFCHFGITSIFLSYFWGISPFVPMQFLAMAPTSVTEIVTEEREKGIAIFRTLRAGDITHLTMENEPRSFSARFCERFENTDERH